MSNLILQNYLTYCSAQKRLDKKTLKAYPTDITQFLLFFKDTSIIDISISDLESYIKYLNQHFKPKTSKRKFASLKTFFRYLEYKEIININPFTLLRAKFREPLLLPKTISLYTIEKLLSTIYQEHSLASTSYQQRRTLLDIAIIETLFSTGMRISELCNLKVTDVDLQDNSIRIYGKGNKERIIQIGSIDVTKILIKYRRDFSSEIASSLHFFTNPNSTPVSDQSIRRMINKYCQLASIDMHITPHMFRHTFATSLLDADVDIRYIQEMLGHSSITVTEIYTHVALSKQKNILATKHPRKLFKF